MSSGDNKKWKTLKRIRRLSLVGYGPEEKFPLLPLFDTFLHGKSKSPKLGFKIYHWQQIVVISNSILAVLFTVAQIHWAQCQLKIWSCIEATVSKGKKTNIKDTAEKLFTCLYYVHVLEYLLIVRKSLIVVQSLVWI